MRHALLSSSALPFVWSSSQSTYTLLLVLGHTMYGAADHSAAVPQIASVPPARLEPSSEWEGTAKGNPHAASGPFDAYAPYASERRHTQVPPLWAPSCLSPPPSLPCS